MMTDTSHQEQDQLTSQFSVHSHSLTHRVRTVSINLRLAKTVSCVGAVGALGRLGAGSGRLCGLCAGIIKKERAPWRHGNLPGLQHSIVGCSSYCRQSLDEKGGCAGYSNYAVVWAQRGDSSMFGRASARTCDGEPSRRGSRHT